MRDISDADTRQRDFQINLLKYLLRLLLVYCMYSTFLAVVTTRLIPSLVGIVAVVLVRAVVFLASAGGVHADVGGARVGYSDPGAFHP